MLLNSGLNDRYLILSLNNRKTDGYGSLIFRLKIEFFAAKPAIQKIM